MTCRKVLFIFVLFVSVLAVAQTTSFAKEKEHILIINSYNKTDQWSYNLINEITETAIAEGFECIPFVEHLNANLLDSATEVDSCANYLLENYKHCKIKAIIVLGNMAWGLLHHDLKKQWQEVPFILCTEFDFIGPKSYYIEKKAIPDSLKIPLERTIKYCNAKLLYSPYYVKHTLVVMKQLIPDMDTLMFISDFRYTSAEIRKELKNVIKKNYPWMVLNCITEGRFETSDLIEKLREASKKQGILYCSWLKKAEINGVRYVISSLNMPINACTPNPVFVLSDMLQENAVVGGYMIPMKELKSSLNKAIKDVLHQKIQTTSVYKNGGGQPILNYQVLQQKQISAELYPSDAIYLNKPFGFFEKNYKELILGFFLILFLAFLPYIRMLVKSKHKEKCLLNKYKNLFINLPIPYMQVKPIFENGRINQTEDGIVDFEVVEINPEFRKYQRTSRLDIGQRIDGAKDKYNFLNKICHQAYLDKKVTSYYHDLVSDKHFDIMALFDEETFSLNIFWMDHTSFWNAKEALYSTNHMLEMALEMANIIPWEWDLKKGYITNKRHLNTINKRIENYILEPILFTEHLDQIHPEDRERVYKSFQNLIDGKIDRIKEELRFTCVDEKGCDYYEWFEMKAIIEARNRIGRPSSILGSSMLITERKDLELNLMNAKNEAEESNRLKSAFLANMSHEIRTPLNAIIGFSKILMDTENEEERHEYMTIIENNNHIMLQLIGDIIDLSKIESGILDFNYLAIDLNALLKSLELSFRKKAADKALSLSLEIPEGAGFFCVEKNRLSQILINLLTNAIKFTDDGEVVFGYQVEEYGIYFYVKDTGCGIPFDKQEKVFERFFKIDSFKQGAGLGLSISKALVQAMSGSIGCKDNGDKGCIFWFRLPFKEAQEKDVEY